MAEMKNGLILRTVPLLIAAGHCERSAAIKARMFVATAVLLLTLVASATARYGGGSGTPDDPYKIATAADLIALGESPEDYDKHFILTADIDLDPNLPCSAEATPGCKVFDKAVIAPDTDPVKSYFQGTPFTGEFVGNGHVISHLTITGKDFLGLFGQLESPSKVKELGVVDVNISGSGSDVGGLAGYKRGFVTRCYSTGSVRGKERVGGLVGVNVGPVTQCYSTGTVTGTGDRVGGLVGENWSDVSRCYSTCAANGLYSVGGLVGCNGLGAVTQCKSSGMVRGTSRVGGLVGYDEYGDVIQCYSSGIVRGTYDVGGLVGYNYRGDVTQCYSTGAVSGNSYVGGLVGFTRGIMTACFWDTQTSGQATSAGGAGKTTAEMQAESTFICWAGDSVWTIDEGKDYPRLSWENASGRTIARRCYGGGGGSRTDPYLIYTSEQINMIGLIPCDWDKHFKLMADHYCPVIS